MIFCWNHSLVGHCLIFTNQLQGHSQLYQAGEFRSPSQLPFSWCYRAWRTRSRAGSGIEPIWWWFGLPGGAVVVVTGKRSPGSWPWWCATCTMQDDPWHQKRSVSPAQNVGIDHQGGQFAQRMIMVVAHLLAHLWGIAVGCLVETMLFCSFSSTIMGHC